MSAHELLVLCGALSSEREVSLRSGSAVAKALPGSRLVVLDADALPDWVDARRHIVIPMLHGGWGEGGGLQGELEARGVAFAGSDAAASRLCMDKVATKARLRSAGLPVADEVAFDAVAPPSASDVIARLGSSLFVKPVDQGSSVGLHRIEGLAELERVLRSLGRGRWMAEPHLSGRELTVGLLDGSALAVVEILTPDGVYDYHSKYAPGGSRHLAPAPLTPELAASVTTAAEGAFRACGCRDFARVDIILSSRGDFHILEVNTLPGMTETSLLPDCAACRGLSYADLAARLVRGARLRAEARVQ
ncbi:MAG: D-alanine--D-alanine ligase family protein [Opitutales bacterium]